jgi:ATP-dependent protease ClpP protease subunit
MKSLLLFALLSLVSFTSFAATKIVLNQNNHVLLHGAVTGDSVAPVMMKLQQLDNNSKAPIYLVLNTPGGSIFDGLELVSFAKSLRRPVHTINIFSASMGFQISQQLGTRYVTEFGELMSHKARGGVEGEFPGQLDSRYAHILTFINDMDAHTVSRTKGKQTIKSYRDLYENEYWAKGTKAVADGFADDVAIVQCDSSLSGTENRKMIFGPFVVNLAFAKCPMITMPIDVVDSKKPEEKVKILRLYRQESRKVIRSF